MLQLDREDGFVPAGIFGQLVVCDHIRANLIRRQVLQPNRRDFGDAKELRRRGAAMTCDDRVRLVQQDGIGEAEDVNAVGDLPNLSFAVSARIARIVLERSDWLVADC